MKVSIDKSKCALCLSCTVTCPEVFEMTLDGVVDVKEEYRGKEITDEALVAKIKEVKEGCPASAIIIED